MQNTLLRQTNWFYYDCKLHYIDPFNHFPQAKLIIVIKTSFLKSQVADNNRPAGEEIISIT